MKASEIMAEKLPGLIDPNLPPDQQPLNDTSNPTIAPRPPQPLHPDQYSAGTNDDSGATPEASSTPKTNHPPAAPAGAGSGTTPSPEKKPQSTTPRNP